jgi:hypothetical protein
MFDFDMISNIAVLLIQCLLTQTLESQMGKFYTEIKND